MEQTENIIKKLGLQPHPEGGYFSETNRSPEVIGAEALPNRFEAGRTLGTAIYFLLKSGEASCFHRIKADEIWHFYSGSPLLLHIIQKNGAYKAAVAFVGKTTASAIDRAVAML